MGDPPRPPTRSSQPQRIHPAPNAARLTLASWAISSSRSPIAAGGASSAACESSQASTPARNSSSLIGTAVDSPALHHELHLLGDADVRERITRHTDDVGQQPGLQAPTVVDIDEFGADDGGSADRLQRRHPTVHESNELLGVA